MADRSFEPEPGRIPRVRPTVCPCCGGEMHHGNLRTPGRLDARVYLEDEQCEEGDEGYQLLDAWVCKECGYVELHTMPSRVYCSNHKSQ